MFYKGKAFNTFFKGLCCSNSMMEGESLWAPCWAQISGNFSDSHITLCSWPGNIKLHMPQTRAWHPKAIGKFSLLFSLDFRASADMILILEKYGGFGKGYHMIK